MKLSKLKPIQELTNIQQLTPICSLSPRGDTVNAIEITLLISNINYKAMMIIEDGKEWTGEKRLLINSHLLIVKRLFGLIDDGYMMKKEFLQIKRDFKIRFDK